MLKETTKLLVPGTIWKREYHKVEMHIMTAEDY
jgi:hypothetical protein